MTRVWVVRAGGGALVNIARSENLAVIGWPEIGDLSAISNEDELRDRFTERYPDEPKSSGSLGFGQLRTFRFIIEEGDSNGFARPPGYLDNGRCLPHTCLRVMRVLLIVRVSRVCCSAIDLCTTPHGRLTQLAASAATHEQGENHGQHDCE